LRRRKTQTVVPAAVVAAKREEREAKIQQGVDQIMLLNLEMPNGKRLRYCTREEVAKFNNGYARLVKKMKPRQMVGQAFNEDQVKAFMK
jgi:FtsZ-binding cell division protein ZapB